MCQLLPLAQLEMLVHFMEATQFELQGDLCMYVKVLCGSHNKVYTCHMRYLHVHIKLYNYVFYLLLCSRAQTSYRRDLYCYMH